MNYLRIFFLFIFFIKIQLLTAQCDTLKLRAAYFTFRDTLPEYYGKFQITEDTLPAVFRLDGKEKNIKLPFSFEYDSLITKVAQCKLMTLRADKSKCVYKIDLQAKNYKTETLGVGTGTNIFVTYHYEDKIDTLLGEYIPPPPQDTTQKDTIPVVQDTVTYKDIEFFFPNVISPNNDFFNDDFRVYASENVLLDKIEIFDRWGSSRYFRQNIFTEEVFFGASEKLAQGDWFIGYIVFKNKIRKKFEFSVVNR